MWYDALALYFSEYSNVVEWEARKFQWLFQQANVSGILLEPVFDSRTLTETFFLLLYGWQKRIKKMKIISQITFYIVRGRGVLCTNSKYTKNCQEDTPSAISEQLSTLPTCECMVPWAWQNIRTLPSSWRSRNRYTTLHAIKY